jgi:hypothetical protein
MSMKDLGAVLAYFAALGIGAALLVFASFLILFLVGSMVWDRWLRPPRIGLDSDPPTNASYRGALVAACIAILAALAVNSLLSTGWRGEDRYIMLSVSCSAQIVAAFVAAGGDWRRYWVKLLFYGLSLGVVAEVVRMAGSGDNAASLVGAIAYLGTRNDGNGVLIKSINFSRNNVTASAGSVPGEIKIDIDNISALAAARQQTNPTFAPNHLRNILGAGFLMHEARHKIHYLDFGYPNSWQTEMRNELNGYATQRSILRSYGVTTPLWSPGMSEKDQKETLWRHAVNSTTIFCGTTAAGNC